MLRCRDVYLRKFSLQVILSILFRMIHLYSSAGGASGLGSNGMFLTPGSYGGGLLGRLQLSQHEQALHGQHKIVTVIVTITNKMTTIATEDHMIFLTAGE